MDVLEPKYYAAIGMVMTLIAVIFLFLMGSAFCLLYTSPSPRD